MRTRWRKNGESAEIRSGVRLLTTGVGGTDTGIGQLYGAHVTSS